MKLSLRNLALAATITLAGAAFAQDAPTVTLKWQHHVTTLNGGSARTGNAVNGKVYIADNEKIYTIDSTGVQTPFYTAEAALNRGLFVDEAGNVLINKHWPTSANNWGDFRLISADGQTVKDITITAPTENAAAFPGGRMDICGRAIGDFFSEQGGLCYISAQNVPMVIPVWIASGEQVPTEYCADVDQMLTMKPVPNNMACVQPIVESMDEVDESTVKDAFIMTSSNGSNVFYMEEGVLKNYPRPVIEGFNALQNGFDHVTLGGKTYFVRHHTNNALKNWGSEMFIYDTEGNIVFQTNYPEEFTNIYDKTGNGCNIIVRKINDYKAEVYQIFAGATEKSFVAMYEFTVPEPTPELYITGQCFTPAWSPAEPAAFTYDATSKTLVYANYRHDGGGFKMSTAKGTWDDFNGGLVWVEGNQIQTGKTYTLNTGAHEGDFNMPKGTYTFTVDLAAMTLAVTGEQDPFVAPELYVRGAFNDWGYSDATKLATDGAVKEGFVTYTATLPVLEGEFKIASSDWSIGLGSGSDVDFGNVTVTMGGQNMKIAKAENVKLTLKYPEYGAGEFTLTIAGDRFVTRKAFAYDLKAEMGENNAATLSYKSSSEAKAAELVLTNAEGNETVINLPAPVKGENTAAVSLADLAEGNYSWAVRLTSELAGDAIAPAYKAPDEWLRKNAKGAPSKGGVVSIRDNESPAYGYTVVGMGMACGFAIYNPAGELVTETPIFKDFAKLNATNNSSASRGDAFGGLAGFSDWSDKGSGVWMIDPLNPTAEPYNIFAAEGATQVTNGTWSYNGVQTGSGSSTVAVQGKGENAKMFMFDEDIYGNTLVRYDLGTAKYVTAAPTLVMSDYKGKMVNLNIEVEPVENGFFVSQNRAAFCDATPGLMFFNNEGTMVWNSSEIAEADRANYQVDASGGIAVSNDGTLMAIIGMQSVNIYTLEFNEYGEPALNKLYTYATPVRNGSNGTQACFDQADNLMVFDGYNNGYTLYVIPGESVATTAAPAASVLAVESGLNTVTTNGAVEYFNLQGVRVNANNLTPGIYVRRQGNKAVKVTVK